MLISLFSGVFAGCVHVLAGPDHLAAVAPLSLEHRSRAWEVGARWGFGHAGGVLVVGCLALLLRDILPMEGLSAWSERLVGVVLIGIGLWGLRKAMIHHLHTHEHQHEGERHVHIHVHGQKTAHQHTQLKNHFHTHAAMAIGTLHGLAGSSHVWGVLPALAFDTQAQAVCYLAAYGLGTVAAMASFSSIIGLVARGSVASGNSVYRGLMYTCSVAAVAIGAFWLVG